MYVGTHPWAGLQVRKGPSPPLQASLEPASHGQVTCLSACYVRSPSTLHSGNPYAINNAWGLRPVRRMSSFVDPMARDVISTGLDGLTPSVSKTAKA